MSEGIEINLVWFVTSPDRSLWSRVRIEVLCLEPLQSRDQRERSAVNVRSV
jgi:hypothetical protein